jgi:hypothetical protein
MASQVSSEETVVSSDAQEPPDSPSTYQSPRPQPLTFLGSKGAPRQLIVSTKPTSFISRDDKSTTSLLARATSGPSPGPPALDDAAIAGVVIGSIAAAGLLIFCIYPFIIRSFRRRRDRRSRRKPAADAEAANGVSNVATAAFAREDKQNDVGSRDPNGPASRGVPSVATNRNFDALRTDGQRGQVDIYSMPGLPGRYNAPYAPDNYQSYRNDQDTVVPLPFPTLDGEFYPASTQDDEPGVLKGTSADYYSPSIPSEAFGMITEPIEENEVQNRPDRSLSRGSSLRHNVKQMFRHKSTRDRTMSSRQSTTIEDDETESHARADQSRGAGLRSIITDDHTASPTEVSPTAPDFPPASHFRPSPSPPTQAAPGTVNPMDIMPATTFSERWHQTEHQLYLSSHPEASLSHQPPLDVPEIEVAESDPPPKTVIDPPQLDEDSEESNQLAPTQFELDPGSELSHGTNVEGLTGSLQGHLSPGMGPGGRRPSYASEVSTPMRDAPSTVPSSQNTPSTLLDTDSPKSSGSSDFRHSASPPAVTEGLAGEGGHIHRCKEPGCTQSFDQLHKLKHHQRYHAKEHKCYYPGCNKGFGTKTHLQRHINDRHEKKKKFHCSIPDCDYSRMGGKAFPRKDNWKRHMTKIHNMEGSNLPEPVEVDHEMGGT